MCHPAIVAAVSVAGSLAGAAVQSNGVRQQAEANARAEERRAELADRQKEVNQTQASFDRRRTLDQLQKVLASNRAAGAERGLSESGSLTDVMDDNSNEAAQTIEAIRYRAEGERDNLTFEAGSSRQRAQSYRQAGRMEAAGTMLGAFTGAATTLGGAFYKSLS